MSDLRIERLAPLEHAGTPLESCIAQLPSLRMHFIAAGPPNGIPVVLLHGFPEFWYSWRFQISALAKAGFRVYAPDQRGYNLSDKHGPYDLSTLTRDIADFQDALDIRQSHVVGHDWGSIVAWSFCARFPERVIKHVSINGPHPDAYLETCRKHPRQIRASWYVYFFRLPFLPERMLRRNNYGLIESIFSRLPNRPMTKEDIQCYKDAYSQPGALSAMLGWYRALLWQALRGRFSVRGAIVTAPTCVIWGERDVALLKECNEPLPKYVRDLEVNYIRKATHWVQMDHANETNASILKFLSS